MAAWTAQRWRGKGIGLLIVLFCGAVGIGLGWRLHRPLSAHQSLPATTAAVRFPLAICAGQASYAEAIVQGEVRLHQALLPSGTLAKEALQDAVALQLRYAFASAQNAAAEPPTLTPDGPPHNIEILAQKPVPYGNDLKLDWTSDPQLQPESDYVQRALARRQISATDGAIAVTYRARVGLALCDPKRASAPKTVFGFPVPHDPYLLYWHIGPEKRVVQVYGKKRARTFPCADPEIADYDHPEYLWYFWQPLQPGCEALLPSPRVLGWASVQIIKRLPPSGDFSQFKRGLTASPASAATTPPLRIVLVFGYLDHQVERPDLAQLQKCLSAPSEPSPHKEPACSYNEWGVFQYDRFLQLTHTLLTGQDRVVRIRPEAIEVELHGRLRRSGRQVTITTYLTETDFLGPPQYAPRHVPLLLTALHTADVVLYVGHSGLGVNFSVAQLQKSSSPAAVETALRGSPVKVLGFVGCYTYSYFGHDFRQRLGSPEQPALFVYTGNAVAKTAASALHILDTLDCILQSPDGKLRPEACNMSQVGDPKSPDFLIYESAR